MELYNVRNQIAHGVLLSTRIDMARVIEDFFRIQSIACAGVIERPLCDQVKCATLAVPGRWLEGTALQLSVSMRPDDCNRPHPTAVISQALWTGPDVRLIPQTLCGCESVCAASGASRCRTARRSQNQLGPSNKV